MLQCEPDYFGGTDTVFKRKKAIPLSYVFEHIDQLIELDADIRWSAEWLNIRTELKRFTSFKTGDEIQIPGGRR
jgi:hypothetical protein